MHVLMVAAENGALPGGKVGGVGDVIRDVPLELARKGHRVSVVTPGYQFLTRLPDVKLITTLTVEFSGSLETLSLYSIATEHTQAGVEILLLDHPFFGSADGSSIYHHDEFEPFATDARNFALFCHALCYALVTGAVASPDVLHLHDWHSSMLLVLREFYPAYKSLKSIPTVFTIHNLSLQGIRPFTDNWSSLEQWFPTLHAQKHKIIDPRYQDCMNLMRAGLNLADKVHVVSPTYAEEIQHPSNPELGLIRGEGLEKDLQETDKQERLFGILNGCIYEAGRTSSISLKKFLHVASNTLEQWAADKVLIKSSLFYGLQRLQQWSAKTRKPPMVVASVGRLTEQKVKLLTVELEGGSTALDAMLQKMKGGIMIVLGSGDADYECFLQEVMIRHDNFLFLNGFSEEMADVIYRFCDLFLMPSSFEPCGISQMLAMRAGTPTLAHKVGGLADTVVHMENGFCFEGEGFQGQAKAMLACFEEVLQIQSCKLPLWNGVCKKAKASRFTWAKVVEEYESKLYS